MRRLAFSAAASVAILCLFCLPCVFGVPASPHSYEVRQPDGTVITLFIRGDEHFHWEEDAAGFTVVARDDGAYVYAILGVKGELAPSGLRVGIDRPELAGITPHLLPAPQVRQKLIRAIGGPVRRGPDPQQGLPPGTGTVKNVVILMRFSNHLSRPLPSNGNMDVIFNAVGGDPTLAPTGSVRDVYLENSYNQLTLNSTVFGWVNLPQTEQFYAAGVSGLGSTIWQAITAALEAADPLIDFDQFDDNGDNFVDAIAFIHSGYGAEWGGTDQDGTHYSNRIWSHRWSIPTWTSDEGVRVSDYHISPGLWGTSGSQPGRIGVICHETGHFFGLPDLYDVSQVDDGAGLGSWCMMANSWGFTGNQRNPPHFSAWCKEQLGWVAPTVLSIPGTYPADQVEQFPQIYRIDDGYPSGEYILIENRQPFGIESTIPQGGLAIWHVDEAKCFSDGLCSNANSGYPGQPGWPGNDRHYRIALLQADGQYELERPNGNSGDADDLYRAGIGEVNKIDALTTPNLHSYQNGVITGTSHRIHNVSTTGPSMTFDYALFTPALGACCDDANGTCTANTTSAACFQNAGRFFEGATCSACTASCCTPNNNGTPANPNDDFTQCQEKSYSNCTSGGGVIYPPNSCSTPPFSCPRAQCINGVGSCLGTHANGGCDNLDCCDSVCDVQPSCCTSGWTAACVSLAGSLCSVGDDCEDAIPIFEGVTLYNNNSATTDGPPDCTNGDDLVGTKDLWYVHTATCSGNLTVSLCTGTDYDATLQVYQGTSCSPLGTQLNCADDTCGIGGGPPVVTRSVTLGQDYLMRVGGWGDDTGSGRIEITLVPTQGGPDCQPNGLADACDLARETSLDCNGNTVPDECDLFGGSSPDCNNNDVPDECDVLSGFSLNCNGNAVPDECELDCQPNGIPDDCDIAADPGLDVNDNGIPDVCEAIPPPVSGDPSGLRKNRSLSIMVAPATAAGSEPAALRVRLVSLHHPSPPNAPCCPGPDFTASENQIRWVGSPTTFPESAEVPAAGSFVAAKLQCAPFYHDWTTVGMFHLYGDAVVPSSEYVVQSILQGSDVGSESAYSAELPIETSRWGDVDEPFSPPDPTTQPDFVDVSRVVDKFKNLAGAPIKTRAMLQPDDPNMNQDVSFLDISATVDAFKGLAYPFDGPTPCGP